MGTIKTYCPEFLSGWNVLPPVFVYQVSQRRQAKVQVIPYQSVIQYQYSGEPLKAIFSSGGILSYTIEEREVQCPGIEYQLIYQEAIISGGTLASWRNVVGRLPAEIAYDAPFSNERLYIRNEKTEVFNRDSEDFLFHWSFRWNGLQPDGSRSRLYTMSFNSASQENFELSLGTAFGRKIIGFEPVDPLADCPPECIFTVYEDGNIIFQSIRSECPEVSQFCQFDYNRDEIITVELNRFDLFYVAVGVNSVFDIFDYLTLLNSLLNSIPFDNDFLTYLENLLGGNLEECLILFKLTPFQGLTFIGQICSDKGCPPPFYEVDCEEEEECPEDTCKVDCGDHYCCYNDQGISVKSIAK